MTNIIKKILYTFVSLSLLTSFILSGCEKKEVVVESSEKIGIIGAMDVEVTSLKEATKIKEIVNIADMEFFDGVLGDKNVVVVKCNMGKVNAGVCASILINTFKCTKIINTGCAGSLDNKLDIGDVVVSIDGVQHDFDTEPIGFLKGEIPYTGLYAFPADINLRNVAVKSIKESYPDINVYEGRICSGDQFINKKEQKERIISDFGGLCCEMEGAAILHVCYLYHTPCVVIRAISDKPDETSFVEYQVFEKEAAIRSAKIVKEMLRNLD